MEYRAIYTDQEDLEHGLFGRKGSQKKNHKYLLREWINGKWKYYYTQAEIQAKKLGKKISKEAKSVQKDISKAVKNGGKDAKKSISKAISNGKKKVDKALKNLNKTSTKALKDAKKQIDKGKKAVNKFLTEGPNIYATYENTSKWHSGITGLGVSNKSYAKAHESAAITDVVRGFSKAGKEIKKGFTSAARNLSDANNYRKGNKLATNAVNKVVDNAGLQFKYYETPSDYDWHVSDVRFAKSLDEYKKSKKKK